MKEQLEVLFKKLQKNLDRVTIGVFFLLLLFSGFLYFQESSFQMPQFDAGTPQPWDRRIPDEEGYFDKLRQNFVDAQPDINEDPVLRRLVQINIFDAKSLRAQEDVAQEIEQDYQRAREMVQAQDYDGALDLIESILRRNPNHRRTLELKEQVEEAQQAETSGGEATQS